MEEHIVFITDHIESKLDEEHSISDAGTDEQTAFVANQGGSDSIVDGTYDNGEYYNFDHVPTSDEMDICLIYYDWLANSGATSYITHLHDTFHTYETIPQVPIAGVGGLKAHAIGKGTVHLKSECKGHIYILELSNVLHIPNNRNNLLLLGQWEANRYSIHICNGKLMLLTEDAKPIARGTKVCNKLYKFTFRHVPGTSGTVHSVCVFNAMSPPLGWETWHRHFGHVAYSGIKKLFNSQLVDGLQIDTNSPTPDCIACTEAKLSEAPYGPALGQTTKPSELMHMDLWGKYDVASINGNQYYLLMVDDTAQYITVKFLKTKDQAAQKIKDYITYLKA